MFGLFKKGKNYKTTVTEADKNWIENNIYWFIENFGFENQSSTPFILPTKENFPYDNLEDDKQFHKLFNQICDILKINPKEVKISLFDDIHSQQWSEIVPMGNEKSVLGLYREEESSNNKKYKIDIAKSNLHITDRLITVLVHELLHVKLLGGNYVGNHEHDMEPLTDLACIFFGFGIFMANSVISSNIYWISKSGYLPNEVISYANALMCYITDNQANTYNEYLNSNTKSLFKKDYEYLINTGNTILGKRKIEEGEKIKKLYTRLNLGFQNKDFIDIITTGNKILETYPKDVSVLNNIGYSYLLQKRYNRAIEMFSKAIVIDPYWSFPYNNRGYCKLQMGDLDSGIVDIKSAYEMDTDNAFSLRNMGVYYLISNDLEKALENFLETEKLDPKTEMINFYLSKTYEKLGEVEKSQIYMEKSKKSNEHNDSVF